MARQQLMLLWLTVFGVWSGSWAIAKDPKNGAAPQSDPIMQTLSKGVDRLDEASTTPTLQHRDPRYRLESGDVVSLQFQFTPEFNQTLTVQPDGFITLKETGDLHVEGESLPELRQQLHTAYAKILHDPVITIDLKEFEKPYFLALGQVARPGKYELHSDTTVSAAVAMAGGFTPMAKHSQVLLFHRVNDNWSSVTKIDVKHMLQSRNLAEDASLRPGDMVYVPQSTISKIKSFVPTPSMGMYTPIP